MWFDFSDSENILIHSHAEPELFYVLEGEADVTADEDKIHLEKDDFIVINANRPHSVKGKNDFLSGFIHMDYKKICEYMGNGQVFFICDSTKENQESYEEIRKIVRRIFGKYFERDGLALIRLDIFFHQLLAELIGNFQIFQASMAVRMRGEKIMSQSTWKTDIWRRSHWRISQGRCIFQKPIFPNILSKSLE